MMGNAFTPGPWAIDRRDQTVVIRGGCNESIAEICDPAVHRHGLIDLDERKANASAIIAVPKLVEALQKHVALIELHRKTGIAPIRKMLIQLEKTQALLASLEPYGLKPGEKK